MEQGGVFRLELRGAADLVGYVSIPLEQGKVFRHTKEQVSSDLFIVSIPLEQGGVFRRKMGIKSSTDMRFQSLWSRAWSFDGRGALVDKA